MKRILSIFFAVLCVSAAAQDYHFPRFTPGKFKKEVRAAAQIWNDTSGNIHFRETRRDGIPVIFDKRGYKIPSQYLLGWYDGKQIIINGLYFKRRPHPLGRFSMRAILLHEFGHAGGLRHNQRRTSIMFPIIYPSTKPELDENDKLAPLNVQSVNPEHPKRPFPPSL